MSEPSERTDHVRPARRRLHAADGCGCGHASGVPRLDVRPIPREVRHATVRGAMGVIAPGSSLEVVVPGDPASLLAQLSEPGSHPLTVEYLESGPQAWVLRLTRPGGADSTRC